MAPDAAAWRGFTAVFAWASALVFAGLLGFVAALDPYDTGRFALVNWPGVPAQGPRTAAASRARDPAFDGAVLGNSYVQMLSPADLSAGTGIPFVTLAIPGTGPREQFRLLDYLLRHRARPLRALVWGIDPFWCRPDPAMPTWLPFPFWLYDPSPWTYLAGLVRDQSLEDASKRLGQVLGLSRRPLARPDGYADYDEGLVWTRERHGAFWGGARVPSTVPNESDRFPALDALGAALDRLPADLPVVLLRPPVAAPALPEPGSDLDRSERACRSAMARLAEGRPSVTLVDWRVDRPEVHVPENFIDPTHYRSAVARAVEADVARALSAAPGGSRREGPR